MTGFAQVTAQAKDGTSFVLSLKSVNHRFLDPQLRLPSEMDELEIKIRRVLKERMDSNSITAWLQALSLHFAKPQPSSILTVSLT